MRLRSFKLGAWIWIVFGLGHSALFTLSALTPADARVEAAYQAMRAAALDPFGGLPHNLLHSYNGSSAAAGLLGLGFGVLLLTIARVAPEALAASKVMLATALVVTAGGLAIAIAAYPLPPVIALAVAAVAFLAAMATRKERVPG